MTREEEVLRLRKEVAFLDARWSSFKHRLRVIREGHIEAVVNGVSSPDYSHFMYLEKRRARALARLAALTPAALP